jgi:hypothetical protein
LPFHEFVQKGIITPMMVPSRCLLDGFVDYSAKAGGVHLRELSPFQVVCAKTQNNEYRIVPIDPHRGEVLIQGGQYFMQPSEAHFSGSTFGGCMIKVGWIGVGMSMEICADGRRIVTTPVQSILVQVTEFRYLPEN